ncbi:sensor domain-containing diguanylate cyclase [Bacillus sp. DJP31]|uniref:GGDEF domain-containing protein n=1 Tax=Bacillus sp. DJP31 TaxID=3409789 RepID=UPI003BB6BFFF
MRVENETFENVFTHTSIGMVLVDLEWKLLKVNHTLCNFLGYSEDELLKKGFQDITHPDDLDKYFYNMKQVLNREIKTYEMEKRYFHRGGHIVWVLLSGSLVFDSNGHPKYFISEVQDISEKKELEFKLLESNNRFKVIFEKSGIGIVLRDKTGNAIEVNDKYLNMLGCEREEVDNIVVDAEDKEKEDKLYKQLMNGSIHYYEMNKRYIGKDGTLIWGRKTVTKVGDYSLAMVHDITMEKAREQMLIEVNDKLKKLSTLDGLTNIPNRRMYEETLDKQTRRVVRESEPISLLMLDIDCFKAFNDTYGHLEGDTCLINVADTIVKSLYRPEDFVARYGGEEFSVILPQTTENTALQIAERIRSNVEKIQIPNINSVVKPIITLSIGVVTEIPTIYTKNEDLILKADKALYFSKENGRNQVSVYSSKMNGL